jgi:hypothetical protein
MSNVDVSKNLSSDAIATVQELKQLVCPDFSDAQFRVWMIVQAVLKGGEVAAAVGLPPHLVKGNDPATRLAMFAAATGMWLDDLAEVPEVWSEMRPTVH